MTLQDAVALFLDAKRGAGKSRKTVEWYEYQLGCFLRWLDGRYTDGSWFRPEAIDRFLNYERARGMSDSTVASRYRALDVFFRWLRRRRYLPSDMALPTEEMDAPKTPKAVVAYVTLQEFRRLYQSITGDDWSDWRDRALLLLLFWSGLRVSEVAALRFGDVDTTARLVTVQRGKGGKGRLVPCAAELMSVLVNYLYSRPPYEGQELFLSNDGYGGVRGPLTTEGIRQMLRRRCKAARMRHLNPHAFRHGFAMEFLNAGMDMSAVSSVLGHTSEKITESIYAHWLTDGLSREYEEVRQRLATKKPHND